MFFTTTVRNQELKQEKKVTFARLLDKVSSEMSSGSELEGANITVQPPSPSKDLRSPNSTSSNQGSDSLSSSEQMLAVHSGETLLTYLEQNRIIFTVTCTIFLHNIAISYLMALSSM